MTAARQPVPAPLRGGCPSNRASPTPTARESTLGQHVSPPGRRRYIWLIGLAALLTTWPAAAHDPSAEWIRTNPNFTDRHGAHCCSEDCQPAEHGEMLRTPAGWTHLPTGTSIRDDEPGNYGSKDEKLWRCVRGGMLRCVFTGAGV